MKNRICKHCGDSFKVEEFPVAGIVNDKTYYRHVCVKCYSAIKKKRKDKIAEWFVNYKKTCNCKHCGNNDHRVLEFHHKDTNNKEFTLGEMKSKGFSIEKMKFEIKKCIPLCANCHKIVHYEHRGK